jgi:hypothetical protein
MSEANRAFEDLKFEIEKSLRYHQRRRAHYESAHRRLAFLIVISGSAAVAFIPDIYKLFGLVAPLLALVDLVYSPGMKAREHLLLHHRFADLMRDMAAVDHPTDEQVAQWRSQRVRIESDEPPIFWALEADCYNEVAKARGNHKTDFIKQGLFRHLLMQWVRFDQVQT